MLLTVFFFWDAFCRCGPPSRYWCMRFEAKNSYFKDLAHRIKNFKNIPKSLAHRHQAWSCYIYSNSAAGGRIFKDFTTGPGMVLCNLQSHCGLNFSQKAWVLRCTINSLRLILNKACVHYTSLPHITIYKYSITAVQVAKQLTNKCSTCGMSLLIFSSILAKRILVEALPYAAHLCAAVSEIEMESAVQRYNCYI